MFGLAGLGTLTCGMGLFWKSASWTATSGKDHPVHGGRHDKFFVGGHSVEVPRHTEIVEYTARGILRTFEQLCAEASKEEHP
jgi:hypothetical protein